MQDKEGMMCRGKVRETTERGAYGGVNGVRIYGAEGGRGKM